MIIKLPDIPKFSYRLPPKVVPVHATMEPRALSRFLCMNGWQQRFFPRLKDQQFFIMIAPCGSGKSFFFINHQIYDVHNSGWTRKQLTIVPQKGIGGNFSSKNNLDVIPVNFGGTDLTWSVTNLCRKGVYACTKELKSWLLEDVSNLKAGKSKYFSYVATHASFVAVWKVLTQAERLQAIRNLTLYIDECHHVTEGTGDEATELGRILAEIMDSKELSVKVRMTTATLFRGDKQRVLTKEHYDLFTRERLEMEEYLASTGIEEFHYKCVHYEGNPLIQVLKNILREPHQHHLVIIPPLNRSNYRGKNTLQDFLAELNDAGLVSIDLVTPATQDRNWEAFEKDQNKYQVVVSCKIFEEGKDWPALSRLHDTAISESQVAIVQRIGRLLRAYFGKRDVVVYLYISRQRYPAELDLEAKEKVRAVYNDRMNITITLMLIDDLMDSIRIPKLPSLIKPGMTSSEKTVGLRGLLEDEDFTKFLKLLSLSYDNCENKTDPEERDAAVNSVIRQFYDGVLQKEISFDDFKAAAHIAVEKYLDIVQNKKVRKIDLSYLRKNGLNNLIASDEPIGSMVFGTKENIILTLPEYRKNIYPKGLVKSAKTMEAFKTIETTFTALPRHENVLVNSQYKGRWVEFKVPEQGLLTVEAKRVTLKNSIGYVVDHQDDACELRVYPRKTVTFKNGQILLNDTLKLRGDTGYWAPHYVISSITHETDGAIRKKFVRDSDISKQIKIPTNLITSII